MKRINRLWFVYAAVLLVTVAQGIGILAIANHAHGSTHAVTTLTQIEALSNRLNALEWQAVADGAVAPDLREELGKARAGMSSLLSELIQPGAPGADLDRVRRAYAHYVSAVDEEFRTLDENNFTQAKALNEAQTDPAFAELSQALAAASNVYHREADSQLRTQELGTALTLLVAAVASGLLFMRARRAELAEQSALAEQQVLMERSRVAEAMRIKDAAIDNAMAGIILCDEAGKIIFANRACLALWRCESQEAFLGRPLRMLLADSDLPAWPIGDESATSGWVCETTARREDGSPFDVQVSASLARDDYGRPVAIMVSFLDISPRKRAEEALAQAHAGLEQRVAMRTAELRASNRLLQQRSDQLHTLHEIDQAILQSQAPDEIARVAIHHVRKVVSCERADLVLLDSAAQRLRWLAVDSSQESGVGAGHDAHVDDCRLFEESAPDRARIIEDLQPLPQRSPLEEVLLSEGMRSYLSVPLLAGDQRIGALSLWRSVPGAWDSEQVQVVRQIASSLAVALLHGQLYEQLRFSREHLQRLARQLVDAQESERQAIAHELHDEAGQGLTALTIGLGLLEREVSGSGSALMRIGQLKETTNQVSEGLHRLAANLRPASLDRLGLVPALRQYVQSFSQQTGIKAECVVTGFDDGRLPPPVETALYRIIQEALTNAARHARPTRVGVILERRSESVIAVVEDDGIGFDPEEAGRRGRLGLLGMRERAEALGGTLEVESQAAMGTTIFVKLPYHQVSVQRRPEYHPARR